MHVACAKDVDKMFSHGQFQHTLDMLKSLVPAVAVILYVSCTGEWA